MMNTISNFLWSMWEIAGQLPNEYGGVVEEDGRFLYEKMETMVPHLCEETTYWVPRDVLALIIRHSLPSALSSVNLVCKLWYQIASTDAIWQSCRLTKLFPEAPVVDEEVWDTYIELEKHGLTFEKKGRPYVRTKREYLEIKRMESAVEDRQGFTVLTLPKGLSVNKIRAFAATLKQGNATGLFVVVPEVRIDWGDKEIKETVTVVITNSVFKNRGVIFPYLHELKCDKPSVPAIMALAIMRFISSKPDAPFCFGNRYALCMEENTGYSNVRFGGWSPDPDEPTSVHFVVDYAPDYDGVAGQRKLAVLED